MAGDDERWFSRPDAVRGPLGDVLPRLLRPVTQRKLFVYPLKGGGYGF
jgi:hypothetical protein